MMDVTNPEVIIKTGALLSFP